MFSIVSVVVSHRPARHLARCLASLAREGLPAVVVDNGSLAGRVTEEARAAGVERVVRLARNRGFAAGANAGARAALGDPGRSWVLLLNDDAELEPGAGERLRGAVARLEPGWMLGLLRLEAADPGRIDSAGLELLDRGRARDLLAGRTTPEAPREAVEIFGPSAGAALYPRDLLERLAGFDEQLFAYYEDVDLSFRARRLGYRARLEPTVRVLHVGGATALGRAYRREVWIERNRLRVATRHVPARELLAALVGGPRAWLRLVRRRPTRALVHPEAWLRWLARLPADLARREPLDPAEQASWRRRPLRPLD